MSLSRRSLLAGLASTALVPLLPKVPAPLGPVTIGVDYGSGRDMSALVAWRMDEVERRIVVFATELAEDVVRGTGISPWLERYGIVDRDLIRDEHRCAPVPPGPWVDSHQRGADPERTCWLSSAALIREVPRG